MAEDSIDLRGIERQIDRIESDLKNKPGLWTFLAIMLGAVFGALAVPVAMFLVWMPREIDRLESRLDKIQAQNNRIETMALLSQEALTDIRASVGDFPLKFKNFAEDLPITVGVSGLSFLQYLKSGKLGGFKMGLSDDMQVLFISKEEFENLPEDLQELLLRLGHTGFTQQFPE